MQVTAAGADVMGTKLSTTHSKRLHQRWLHCSLNSVDCGSSFLNDLLRATQVLSSQDCALHQGWLGVR